MTTVLCPSCRKPGTLTPHPSLEGRFVLNCVCNPIGPTLETDGVSLSLLALPGVNEQVALALVGLGMNSLDAVRQAPDDVLLSVPGIGPATLEKIRAFFGGE